MQEADQLEAVLKPLLIMFVVLLCYFLPAIGGYSRHHRNAHAIAVLNLLAGWTLIGWVIAAVWASTDNVKPTVS